jgi:hypothetical protein
MRHAQRQGPAASGVDANVIYCLKHIPTFSWSHSTAFCRNITLREHGNGASESGSGSWRWVKKHAAATAGAGQDGRRPKTEDSTLLQ